MTDQHPDLIREQALDRAQRRDERKSLVSMPAQDLASAPQRAGFLPQSMGEAMQFANLMADCNFVPIFLRGRPGDCMAIVIQAVRWGMDPFSVANKAYFAKDGQPPAWESQLINAVINTSGALIGRLKMDFEGEGERLRCTVRGRLRADPDEERVNTQSIARITVRNSPLWKADPEQQLGYYVTRAWARRWCPEVLLGVYTQDELAEIVDDEKREARSSAPPRPTREAIAAETAPAAEDEQVDIREMPDTPVEWAAWKSSLERQIEGAASIDKVNALVRGEMPVINASPYTDEIMKQVSDRIADLYGDA